MDDFHYTLYIQLIPLFFFFSAIFSFMTESTNIENIFESHREIPSASDIDVPTWNRETQSCTKPYNDFHLTIFQWTTDIHPILCQSFISDSLQIIGNRVRSISSLKAAHFPKTVSNQPSNLAQTLSFPLIWSIPSISYSINIITIRPNLPVQSLFDSNHLSDLLSVSILNGRPRIFLLCCREHFRKEIDGCFYQQWTATKLLHNWNLIHRT